MTKEQKDRLTVRVTSVGFSILVFALFKPLGIGDLGWVVYLHLAAIWVLGIGGCYVTEAILKYIVRMPASFDKGAEYIIRRNLRFQLINTPLMALMCCVYFSLFTSHLSLLTLSGYLTMLLILAFCSFVIGLFWRFKFLNERLKCVDASMCNSANQVASSTKTLTHSHIDTITLSGSTSENLTLSISDLLYVESVGNYLKIYRLSEGEVRSDMIRATSKQIEEVLKEYPLVVRCHRAFLVNLAQVEKIVSQSGSMQLKMKHSGDTLPVSRSHTAHVKDIFLADRMMK